MARSERGVALDSLRDAWPSDEELSGLVAGGAVEMEVAGDVELGEAEPERSVRFVRFLRDAISNGLHVRWHGRVIAPALARLLVHLQPPLAALEGEADLAAWRAAHAYGQCFWRRGPGFVVVKDRRPGQEPAQFLIEDQAMLRVFEALLEPTRPRELGTADAVRQAVSGLLDEKIAIQIGDWAVALPYRLRRWPIPHFAL